MMMSVSLSACGTATRPKIAISSDACLNFDIIRYAQLSLAVIAEATRIGEPVRDDGNLADRDSTVMSIQDHNAKYRALCPDPE